MNVQFKERPILFSASMVRAILEGGKTQTRRVIKHQPFYGDVGGMFHSWQFKSKKGYWLYPNAEEDVKASCPYGVPGDRLWVRETFGVVSYSIDDDGEVRRWKPDRPATPIKEMPFGKGYYSGHVIYRADGEFEWRNDYGDEISAWNPSIHMPRLASRINLEITGIRVERLQDISEADAAAEGVDGDKEAIERGANWYDKPKRAYRFLWESINGQGSWEKNPWVWVLEFKRC